mmetsp:Transcript_54020/g.128381  ORF Transcript_54020/g.128381 Transcript_54020/m.128381 type:complete len:272 (+) Transcript_54020:206-1021(+)
MARRVRPGINARRAHPPLPPPSPPWLRSARGAPSRRTRASSTATPSQTRGASARRRVSRFLTASLSITTTWGVCARSSWVPTLRWSQSRRSRVSSSPRTFPPRALGCGTRHPRSWSTRAPPSTAPSSARALPARPTPCVWRRRGPWDITARAARDSRDACPGSAASRRAPRGCTAPWNAQTGPRPPRAPQKAAIACASPGSPATRCPRATSASLRSIPPRTRTATRRRRCAPPAATTPGATPFRMQSRTASATPATTSTAKLPRPLPRVRP